MRFRRYLKKIEPALEVPYPERRDLMAEISSHLDDLFDELRAEGLEEAEAEERAVRIMALDDSFLRSMDRVHAPAIRRALAVLPPPISTLVEHVGVGLLAFLVFGFVIVEEKAMIRFFVEMGYFMIPLNLMGLAILILAGERVFSLYIKKDHGEHNIHRRLLSFKFLGMACSLVGVIGTLMGYFQAFSSADRIKAKFDGVFPIWEVSRIAMSTTIWGLTLALVASIAWYVFSAKAGSIERMRLN